MTPKIIRWIILAIAILAHIFAYFQYQLISIRLPIPLAWEKQFNFILFISIVLAMLLPKSKKPVFIWLIIFFRSILVLVVGLPLGDNLDVEQTLLIPLVIEAIEYLSIRQGLFFCCSITSIVCFIHLVPLVAWGTVLPVTSEEQLWSFIITITFFITVSFILNFQQKNQVPLSEINRLFHESTLQLAQVNMQLQEYAASAEQGAIINERKRLARDLHDILAYTLTNLIMMLEEAKDLAVQGGNTLLEHLDNACEQTKEGLDDLRMAVKALRPVNLSVTTGLKAIQQLVNTFNKATQIEVELNLGNAPLNFGEEADLVAYRLIQEGITNALRHGRASKITISFTLINNGVSIHIKDNGIGSSGTQEGYGLTGMRERIGRLGGKFEVSSQIGQGFRLLAWLPIEKGDNCV